MKKLDRNRAFATVHGDGEKPHQFEQDGFFFDAQGNEVGKDPTFKAPKPSAAQQAAQSQREQELADELASAKRASEERDKRDAERDEEMAQMREQLKKLTEGGKGSVGGDDTAEQLAAQARADAIEKFEGMTKDELHKFLKKNKVSFESDANKATLVDLAVAFELAP